MIKVLGIVGRRGPRELLPTFLGGLSFLHRVLPRPATGTTIVLRYILYLAWAVDHQAIEVMKNEEKSADLPARQVARVQSGADGVPR